MKRGSSGASARRTAWTCLARIAPNTIVGRRSPRSRKRLRERARSGRVVRTIEQDAAEAEARAVEQLEAPGPARAGESAPQARLVDRDAVALGERIEERERHRRILGLVRPDEPDAQVGQLARRRAGVDHDPVPVEVAKGRADTAGAVRRGEAARPARRIGRGWAEALDRTLR